MSVSFAVLTLMAVSIGWGHLPHGAGMVWDSQHQDRNLNPKPETLNPKPETLNPKP